MNLKAEFILQFLFQVLIGILTIPITCNLSLIHFLFQVLIGILTIEPEDSPNLTFKEVSSPYRYSNNVAAHSYIFNSPVFQVLIGILTISTRFRCPYSLKVFQVLIGILTIQISWNGLLYQDLFQVLIGILTIEKNLKWLIGKNLVSSPYRYSNNDRCNVCIHSECYSFKSL